MRAPEIVEIQQWVEQCRAESERAVERAETVDSPFHQAEYLKLASEWLILAEETGRLLA